MKKNKEEIISKIISNSLELEEDSYEETYVEQERTEYQEKEKILKYILEEKTKNKSQVINYIINKTDIINEETLTYEIFYKLMINLNFTSIKYFEKNFENKYMNTILNSYYQNYEEIMKNIYLLNIFEMIIFQKENENKYENVISLEFCNEKINQKIEKNEENEQMIFEKNMKIIKKLIKKEKKWNEKVYNETFIKYIINNYNKTNEILLIDLLNELSLKNEYLNLFEFLSNHEILSFIKNLFSDNLKQENFLLFFNFLFLKNVSFHF
jgi:hypothetical protein